MSHVNVNDVRSEALFVSGLQPSEGASAAQVRGAIVQTVRTLGAGGCAARLAQEFGDCPDVAVARMRWARHLVAEIFPAEPKSVPGRQLAHAGPRAA
jgi:hypothetical protein